MRDSIKRAIETNKTLNEFLIKHKLKTKFIKNSLNSLSNVPYDTKKRIAKAIANDNQAISIAFSWRTTGYPEFWYNIDRKYKEFKRLKEIKNANQKTNN